MRHRCVRVPRRGSRAYADCHRHTDGYCDGDAHGYADRDRDGNADCHRHRNGNRNSNHDSNCEFNIDTDRDCNRNVNGNCNRYGHSDRDTNHDPDATVTATPTATVTATPTPTPTPVAAEILISPATLAFGRHRVGSTIEKFVKVNAKKSKKLNLPALIETISVSGGDYASDAASSSCVVGHLLAAGQSCSIAIKFTPPAVTKGESDTGRLIVTTDAEIVKPSGGRIALKCGGK